MKKFILSLVVLSSIQAFSQSPWTRAKGKFFTQIGFSAINYDQVNIDGNKIDRPNNYFDYTFQSYTEYGLTDKIEIQAIIPIKYLGYEAKSGGNKQKYGGLGNVSIGGKYKISDGNWKISTGLLISLNTVYKDDYEGLRTGFEATTIQPYITAGSSSGKLYYFGNLAFGYMSNGYSSFGRLSGEIGYEVFSRAHLILALDAKQPLQNNSKFAQNEKFSYLNSANYLDRQTYTAIGIKGNYEITKDKFGVNFGIFGAAGLKNVASAPSINLGTYFKF